MFYAVAEIYSFILDPQLPALQFLRLSAYAIFLTHTPRPQRVPKLHSLMNSCNLLGSRETEDSRFFSEGDDVAPIVEEAAPANQDPLVCNLIGECVVPI